MGNNKQLFGLLLVLVIIFGLLVYFVKLRPPQAVYHKAVNISLQQLSENNLQLSNMAVEPVYAEKSNTNPRFQRYYQVKVLAKNEKVLFTTQVQKELLVSRFTYPGHETAPYTQLNSQIDLYLPFYTNSEKAVIEDENGNTIMSINLKSLTEETPTTKENLCGNNICDQGENRVSCVNDCP